MPARSKVQQAAAGLAYAAKKGEVPVHMLTGAARQMYNSMSTKQLKEFASTKRKGLPKRKKKEKSK
jgi:hypothetical protein